MFRFTIRDVIWLTIGVALAISWWIDRNRLTSRLDSLTLENEARTAERDEAIADARRVVQYRTWRWPLHFSKVTSETDNQLQSREIRNSILRSATFVELCRHFEEENRLFWEEMAAE